jgi:hypothetical protein
MSTFLKSLNGVAPKQDYIVSPNQLWLDGIAIKPGVVRQFVAMPMDSGYSIERQVTGMDNVGGLQLEIIPARYIFESVHKGPIILVHIKGITGRTDSIQIGRQQTIHELIDKYGGIFGIPIRELTLLYQGKLLQRCATPCPW